MNTNRYVMLEGPEFTLYGLSNDPRLPRTTILRHKERRLATAIRVDVGDKGPLQVRLEPTAALTGRLLDKAGRPLEGIELALCRLINEPTRSLQQEFIPNERSTTHADGRFRLEGLVPGLRQKVEIIGDKISSESYVLKEWTPKPGETKDLGEIRPKGEG